MHMVRTGVARRRVGLYRTVQTSITCRSTIFASRGVYLHARDCTASCAPFRAAGTSVHLCRAVWIVLNL